ncbi:hypothetical protein KP509_12G082900 [Ceratopteris richardii]|uniref:DEX1 C-terminal domain-containing protein n=1 Tax=Ceratopteris richardii TaxID=49495 RepID=A0A8T2TRA0_CERRI|nr:hypothetical protein KP509_12G082900 [Ceratopteris richardii]
MKLLLLLFNVVLHIALLGVAQHAVKDASSNKFRQRQATDDQLPYPVLDEEALTNTQCPQHLELRWQTEVSSSIYATPLVADINGDGKLEIVVPSFVHNIDVLDGSDGEKLPGWPVSHQSNLHSSPLLYDIDKDGVREITVATYNGEVLFYRPSGYQVIDKIVIPRERVRKDWYVGLKKDHADRSHSDLKVEDVKSQGTNQSSKADVDLSQESIGKIVPNQSDSGDIGVATAMKINNDTGNPDEKAPAKKQDAPADPNVSSGKINEEMNHDGLLSNTLEMAVALANSSSNKDGASVHGAQRRLLADSERGSQTKTENEQTPTVENGQEALEDTAAASFEVFRDEEENMEDGLTEEYQYDYDDYVDETMWGDETWKEAQHEKEEDYVNIDAHILSTPVIADIDQDGVDEIIIAVTYFFDREYYDNPENIKELGEIDISKYVACGIVVFNMDTKQLKWKQLLDLSRDEGDYRAHIYSPPTVVDLDNDGFLDIVVGTAFGFCYVLDHRGEARENFPLSMGEIHGQVLASDINSDGLVELVTTDARGNVAAWTNKGKEIWEVHLKSLIAQGPTVGDIDGDGTLDIVVPTVSGNIYVLHGKTGVTMKPYPFRTHGRVMAPVLLVDLAKLGTERRGLVLVVSSFDGYLYLIDGPTACADVVDVGETSYTMVLADNVDGGDDLDLIVTTMNGNVFCFSTPAPYHPLRNQGRSNLASRIRHEGIYATSGSRSFRDEGGESFWVHFNIIDENRLPSGPYNITATLLVPHNYMGPRRITESQLIQQPGTHKFKLPCVSVRSSGTVVLEMVDKHGFYFTDEYSLTFHMHYYRLLKWMVVLPMLGMLFVLLWLHPEDAISVLPSFSRDH